MARRSQTGDRRAAPGSRDGSTNTDFGTREFATLDLAGNLLTFFERTSG